MLFVGVDELSNSKAMVHVQCVPVPKQNHILETFFYFLLLAASANAAVWHSVSYSKDISIKINGS